MGDSIPRLGDYLTILTDYHANGSYERLRENVTLLDAPEYAVMIRTTNFENDDFVDGLKYINEHAYQFLAKSKVHPGDILMNKIANPGSVYRMPDLGRPVSLAMNLFLLRTDETRLHQAYAYYWMKANEAYVKGFACGAATATITKKAVRELEIPIPPLSVQRRVAAVLMAYDDLIANGKQRIRKLVTIARTDYRERLRCATGPVSSKSVLETPYWEFISENVSPYEGTKRYFATADIEKLTIQGAGIEYSFPDKPSRAQKQPIAFSVWFARMKDTYKIAWYTDLNSKEAEASMLSSGFAGFQAKRRCYFPLLFLTISSEEFHVKKDLFCTGATQMSLTNEGLARIQVAVPNEETVTQLGDKTLPLLDQVLVLQLQIQNLRRTRDLLLPRLLSGQVAIDVSKLEGAAA